MTPNPRAWEFVSQIVAQGCANKRVEHSLFAGNIGDSAAVEFSAFLRLYKSLPSIDGILLDPKKADVPAESGTLYAITAALARRSKQENFGRVMTYLERLPVEFSVFGVKDAIGRDKELATTRTFTEWAITHQDVML